MVRLSNGIAEDGRRRRAALAVRRRAPWALSRSDWHAWSSQMAGGPGPGLRRHRQPVLAAGRRARRVHLRPVDADLGRPRQRPAAVPGRRHPDRLRRRLAGAEPDRDRRAYDGAGRPRRRVVLRGQRLEGADLRPGHRRHRRRRRRGRDRQPELRCRVHDPRAADDDRAGRAPGGEEDRADRRREARPSACSTSRPRTDASAPAPPRWCPESTWTGESQYAGTGYVSLGRRRHRVHRPRPRTPTRSSCPSLDLRRGSSAVTPFTRRRPQARLGALRRRRAPRASRRRPARCCR